MSSQPEAAPSKSIEELCAMRLRFFQEALASFQASSSKFRVIATSPRGRDIYAGGNWQKDDNLPSPPIPPAKPPRNLVILDSSFNPPTRAHRLMATSASWDVINNSPIADIVPHGQSLRLLFVLSVNNADKAPKPASFDQRLSMMWSLARDVQTSLLIGPRGGEIGLRGISVDIALSTLPYFHEKSQAISENEFYRGTSSTSPSGEWSGRLRPRAQNAAEQDQEPVTKQVMLVGYDTVIRVFNPKYYRSEEGNGIQKALGPLFDRAKLRVTLRPDDQWGKISEQKQYIKSLFKPKNVKEVGIDPSWESEIQLVKFPTGWSSYNAVSSTNARKAAKEEDEAVLKKMLTETVREWVVREGLYREES